MFGKKRKIEVKVVKDESTEAHVYNNTTIREVGANASVFVDTAVMGGLMLIGAYFAADTIRHCAIHVVATKVQPPIILDAVKSK